eukprot:scaffold126_cov246-Pinguiococcus_pyrenoidosus.AAC.6
MTTVLATSWQLKVSWTTHVICESRSTSSRTLTLVGVIRPRTGPTSTETSWTGTRMTSAPTRTGLRCTMLSNSSLDEAACATAAVSTATTASTKPTCFSSTSTCSNLNAAADDVTLPDLGKRNRGDTLEMLGHASARKGGWPSSSQTCVLRPTLVRCSASPAHRAPDAPPPLRKTTCRRPATSPRRQLSTIFRIAKRLARFSSAAQRMSSAGLRQPVSPFRACPESSEVASTSEAFPARRFDPCEAALRSVIHQIPRDRSGHARASLQAHCFCFDSAPSGREWNPRHRPAGRSEVSRPW